MVRLDNIFKVNFIYSLIIILIYSYCAMCIGPRLPGQGCNQLQQEIVSAMCLDDRCVYVVVLQLIALGRFFKLYKTLQFVFFWLKHA